MLNPFQQKDQKVISCNICHMMINLDLKGEIDGLNENKNYVKCTSGHVVHIEPCLANWILSSDKCPVCNNEYNQSILSKFETLIQEYKEREQRKIQEKQMASKTSTNQTDERAQAIQEKLQRAQKLIDEERYVPSLNILFDILDNDDPKSDNAFFLIGKAHFYLGRFDLAVSNLMRLVKIKFDYPLAFYYLGKSFENLGLAEKAKWAYERSNNTLKKLLEDPNYSDASKEKYQQIIEEVAYLLKVL